MLADDENSRYNVFEAMEMKVSAVRLAAEYDHAEGREAAAAAESLVTAAAASGIGLVVFPAYMEDRFAGFFNAIREISVKYPSVGICPGSGLELCGGKAYRFSELIAGGHTVLHQRQIYLSRKEREAGLDRGDRIEFTNFMGYKTCIIFGADVFYPQVSRMAALEEAELALCPVAYPKAMGRPLQTAGVWREVQQNLFYAVESCFRGTLDGIEYDGEQTVQAPLALDLPGCGFLARGDETASAELDKARRLIGISRFDVLAQLNPALYANMSMFRGDCE